MTSIEADHGSFSAYDGAAPGYVNPPHSCFSGLRAAGFSVMGRRRPQNQDAFFVDPQRRVFLLADGMGGHRAGERASRLAVETLLSRAPTIVRQNTTDRVPQLLVEAFARANHRILAESQRHPQLHGMGTTAVMALVVGRRLFVAAVGDSRAYLIRDRDPEQLTVDHTLAQLHRDCEGKPGTPSVRAPGSNVLWQCLGSPNLWGPDVRITNLQAGDRVVLTSDGVTGFVDDAFIASSADDCTDPAEAAELLVSTARSNGTSDDATSVVIHLDETYSKRMSGRRYG